jgi:serine/threonine protein kinase
VRVHRCNVPPVCCDAPERQWWTPRGSLRTQQPRSCGVQVVVRDERHPATQAVSLRVCVIDFGLSVGFGGASIGGTSLYMSPEQLLMSQPLAGTSDMYR